LSTPASNIILLGISIYIIFIGINDPEIFHANTTYTFSVNFISNILSVGASQATKQPTKQTNKQTNKEIKRFKKKE